MHRFLRHLLRRGTEPTNMRVHRSIPLPRLSPGQVRERIFNPPRRRREGFEADEVRTFLSRTADDLAAALAELAWVRDENDRVKSALRQWQTTYGRNSRWQPVQHSAVPQQQARQAAHHHNAHLVRR